jgi:flagellar hook-associated protein 3 FlgL
MTIQRISTYAIHQNTLNDTMRVQKKLADLQGQISSGSKTDIFQGLGNDVENFISLETRIQRSANYENNNNVVLSRMNTQRTVMSEMIDLTDDMQNLIIARRNAASGDSLRFDQQMLSMRDQLTDMLNASLGGRYLFGGTRTNVPPVVDNPTTGTPGIPDIGYYQGSSEAVIARVDDNIELDYNIRADSQSIQEIIAAIDLSLQGNNQASDTIYEQAQDLITQGIGNLIADQAKLDANIVAIQDINERHSDLQLYWQGVRDELIATDIVEASTQLAIDQTVLQASFQAFSTVNQLRLVDFLR